MPKWSGGCGRRTRRTRERPNGLAGPARAASRCDPEKVVAKHAPRFLDLVNDAKSRVRECSIQDVLPRVKGGKPAHGMHLVDVREESEFAAGHLPGAIHLSKGLIERDIEK